MPEAGERILIVSSFPPRHCGIGAYASAQADRLRAGGHDVVVLSPPDGDGDERRSFIGGAAFRHAAGIGDRFDRVVVHYETGLYFRPRSPLTHVLTSASLLYLTLRRSNVEIVLHEANVPPNRWRPDYRMLGMAFERARLSFHTAAERIALERAYRIRTHWRMIDHTEGVTVHARLSRARARERLGLDVDGPLFVCAGFLQPDKGFDRAIRAFGAAGSPGRLYVVGSVRIPSEPTDRWVEGLRGLAGATPGVVLLEAFVSDEDFDAWVEAADRMVFPYRRAWSSGALARSQRLGTPALVSDAGGLAEQAGPDDAVFETDEALAELFARAVPAGGLLDGGRPDGER
jgi:glycosyltransferase involved in cell wall biosynthesis